MSEIYWKKKEHRKTVKLQHTCQMTDFNSKKITFTLLLALSSYMHIYCCSVYVYCITLVSCMAKQYFGASVHPKMSKITLKGHIIMCCKKISK